MPYGWIIALIAVAAYWQGIGLELHIHWIATSLQSYEYSFKRSAVAVAPDKMLLTVSIYAHIIYIVRFANSTYMHMILFSFTEFRINKIVDMIYEHLTVNFIAHAQSFICMQYFDYDAN